MEWFLQNAERAGIVTHLVFDIVAFMMGWVVPGKQYTEKEEEVKAVRLELREANERDRSRLEKIERDMAEINRRS